MSAGAEETEFSALEKLASEEMRISLCGTVYRIEEKAEVTAFYLKDNAVSSADGNMKESKFLSIIPGKIIIRKSGSGKLNPGRGTAV